MRGRDEIQVGELVQSLSGHDAGDFFLVIRKEDGFVWLCDGKNRKAACCKRKNQKHIAGSGLVCGWVKNRPQQVNNTSVREAIKELRKQRGGEA